MCDANMLWEYGLVGAFDTVALMRGEEVAIITSVSDSHSSETAEEDNESNHSGSNALDFEGISFLDIQYSSEQLAAVMFHRFGVRCGDAVVVACHRHLSSEVVSLLACARIGAPFIPVDDDWLHRGYDRVRSIIDDCRPIAAIVVGRDDKDPTVQLFARCGLHRILYLCEDGTLNEQEIAFADYRNDLPPSPFLPSQSEVGEEEEDDGEDIEKLSDIANRAFPPLYILYTSGSTGKPKGVCGTHWGLINRIAWQLSAFPWASNEVVCRRTPLTFVDSLVEIFAPLLAAVPLWKPSSSAEGLLAYAREAAAMSVSRLILLPSQLLRALRTDPALFSPEVWPALRYVHVSGEVCPPQLVRLVQQLCPQIVLINLFGSTEVAGDVTFAVLTSAVRSDDDSLEADFSESMQPICLSKSHFSNLITVPIGKSIPNNLLLICSSVEIDEETQRVCCSICEDGEEGEMLVFGAHTAANYFQRPKENSERFIECNRIVFRRESSTDSLAFFDHPIVTEFMSTFPSELRHYFSLSTVFRMGDRALRQRDSCGVIEWLGRTDHQYKVNGVRLELEDVQQVLSEALGVSQGIAVVVANSARKPKQQQQQQHRQRDGLRETETETETETAAEELTIVLFVEDAVLIGLLHKIRAALASEQTELRSEAETESDLALSSVPTLLLLRRYLSGSDSSSAASASASASVSASVSGVGCVVPSPLLPSRVLSLPALPLTSSGKIDRTSLRAIAETETETERIETQTETETEEAFGLDANANPIADIVWRVFCVCKPYFIESNSSSSSSSSSSSNSSSSSSSNSVSKQFSAQIEQEIRRFCLSKFAATEFISQFVGDRTEFNSNIFTAYSFELLGINSINLIELIWKINKEFSFAISLESLHQSTIFSLAIDIYNSFASDGSCRISIDVNNKASVVSRKVYRETEIEAFRATDSVDDKGSSRYVLRDWFGRYRLRYANQLQLQMDCNSHNSNSNSNSNSNVEYLPTKEITLKEVWNSALSRCVDSSPLCARYTASIISEPSSSDPAAAAAVVAVAATGVLFIGSHGGDFRAFDMANGLQLWHTNLSLHCHNHKQLRQEQEQVQVQVHVEGASALSADGQSVFVAAFLGTAVDAQPQQQLSEVEAEIENQIEGGGEDQGGMEGEAEEQSGTGRLWCLSALTGKVRWMRRFPSEVKCAPQLAHIPNNGSDNEQQVKAEYVEVVVVGCYDGQVYLLLASDGSLLVSYSVTGAIYSAPSLLPRANNERDSGILLTVVCASTAGKLNCCDLYRSFDNSIVAVERYAIDIDCPVFAADVFSLSLLLPLPIEAETKAEGEAEVAKRDHCSDYPSAKRSRSSIGVDGRDVANQSLRWPLTALVCGVDGGLRAFDVGTGNALVGCNVFATKPIFSVPIVVPLAMTSISIDFGDHSNESCPPEQLSLVIFGSHDGFLRCFIFANATSVATDTKADHSPSMGQSDEVDSAALTTAQLLWECDCGSALFSSPALVTSNCDAEVRGVCVAACSTAGDVLLLDLATGTRIAALKLSGEIYSTPVFVPNDEEGNPVLGNLFVGCRDDRVHAIQITM